MHRRRSQPGRPTPSRRTGVARRGFRRGRRRTEPRPRQNVRRRAGRRKCSLPTPTGSEESNATAEQPLSIAPLERDRAGPGHPGDTRVSRRRLSLRRRLLRIEGAGRKDQDETSVPPERLERFLHGLERCAGADGGAGAGEPISRAQDFEWPQKRFRSSLNGRGRRIVASALPLRGQPVITRAGLEPDECGRQDASMRAEKHLRVEPASRHCSRLLLARARAAGHGRSRRIRRSSAGARSCPGSLFRTTSRARTTVSLGGCSASTRSFVR